LIPKFSTFRSNIQIVEPFRSNIENMRFSLDNIDTNMFLHGF